MTTDERVKSSWSLHEIKHIKIIPKSIIKNQSLPASHSRAFLYWFRFGNKIKELGEMLQQKWPLVPTQCIMNILLLLLQDYSVKYLISKGAPPKKIMMSIPTFGRTFELASRQTGIGVATSGPGTPGPITQESGILSYYEVTRVTFAFCFIFHKQPLLPHRDGVMTKLRRTSQAKRAPYTRKWEYRNWKFKVLCFHYIYRESLVWELVWHCG